MPSSARRARSPEEDALWGPYGNHDIPFAAPAARFAARLSHSGGALRQTMAMSRRRVAWLFAAAFWTIFGLVTGIQVWISMITHGHSVPRLIGYYVLVWEAWLAATAFV